MEQGTLRRQVVVVEGANFAFEICVIWNIGSALIEEGTLFHSSICVLSAERKGEVSRSFEDCFGNGDGMVIVFLTVSDTMWQRERD